MLVVFTYDFPHKKSYEGLLKLIYSGFRPDLVIGAPFRDLGFKSSPLLRVSPRGLRYSGTGELCKHFGITYEVTSHDSIQLNKRLNDLKPELGVILGARILKDYIISNFQKGIINMHPGCLPDNRGLDNLKWAIFDELPQAVSTHLIDSKIDLGELMEICTVPVFEDDSYIDVFIRTQNYELESLISVMDKLRDGEFKTYPLHGGKYNKTMNHENEGTVMEKFNWYKGQYSSIRKTYVEANPELPWVNLEN
jgi:phosphoribosylglycinamide formyltransferase-1